MAVIKRISHKLRVFYFSCVDKDSVIKEIRKMTIDKSTQDTNIPVKILKKMKMFFAEYICTYFNDTIRKAIGFKSLRLNCSVTQVNTKI